MMKAINYNGIYTPIVKNNGCEVTLLMKKGRTTYEQVVAFSEFSKRQQTMLRRNKTVTEYRTTKSMMNPNGPDIQVPVDAPAHLDPSTETYWSM